MAFRRRAAERIRESSWAMLGSGALAGLLATYAMGPVTNFLYQREDEAKKRREEALRKEQPVEVLAGRLIELAGATPTEPLKKKLGMVVHLGYGMGWGVLYAFLRRRTPILRKALGLPFGVLFALVGDEIMNQVMGLTAPPKAWPIEAHLRGLAGHVAYAAAAEGTFRAIDAAARLA